MTTPLKDRECYPGTNTPVFDVGDEVEFEVAPDGWPRWDVAEDLAGGSIGRPFRGAVYLVWPDWIMVEFDCIDTSRTRKWAWPLPGDKEYSPIQWERPGYLRHAETIDTSKAAKELAESMLKDLDGPDELPPSLGFACRCTNVDDGPTPGTCTCPDENFHYTAGGCVGCTCGAMQRKETP